MGPISGLLLPSLVSLTTTTMEQREHGQPGGMREESRIKRDGERSEARDGHRTWTGASSAHQGRQ